MLIVFSSYKNNKKKKSHIYSSMAVTPISSKSRLIRSIILK